MALTASIGRARLIAVQNGVAPEKAIFSQADVRTGIITVEHIIERATKTLGVLTHGVIVGDWCYYMANCGRDVLGEDGRLKPASKITAPIVMRTSLGAP